MNYATVSKRCKRCKDMKDISHFGVHHKTKDGYQTVCNECHRIASTKAMAKKVKVARVKEEKVCPCCNTSKPLVLFYKNKVTKDGFMNICKSCFKIKYKKTLQTKPKPILIKKDIPNIGGHPITQVKCLRCGDLLPVSEFYDNEFGKDIICKKCRDIRNHTIKPASFTIKDGFTVSKDGIKQTIEDKPLSKVDNIPESPDMNQVLDDAVISNLIGSFILSGIALFKHIIKDVK